MIPQFMVDYCEKNAKNSFVGELPFQNKGYLTLFNKNSLTNVKFKNPKKMKTHFAYEAEIDKIPKYFVETIKEINSSPTNT